MRRPREGGGASAGLCAGRHRNWPAYCRRPKRAYRAAFYARPRLASWQSSRSSNPPNEEPAQSQRRRCSSEAPSRSVLLCLSPALLRSSFSASPSFCPAPSMQQAPPSFAWISPLFRPAPLLPCADCQSVCFWHVTSDERNRGIPPRHDEGRVEREPIQFCNQ